jgi:hypothetical protein
LTNEEATSKERPLIQYCQAISFEIFVMLIAVKIIAVCDNNVINHDKDLPGKLIQFLEAFNRMRAWADVQVFYSNCFNADFTIY